MCLILQARLDEMAKIFEYDGQDTCAAGEWVGYQQGSRGGQA